MNQCQPNRPISIPRNTHGAEWHRTGRFSISVVVFQNCRPGGFVIVSSSRCRRWWTFLWKKGNILSNGLARFFENLKVISIWPLAGGLWSWPECCWDAMDHGKGMCWRRKIALDRSSISLGSETKWKKSQEREEAFLLKCLEFMKNPPVRL